MKATIKDVARHAGVAISTASNVLNNKSGPIKAKEATRKKIFRAAEELNYTPSIMAKGLRSGKTFLAGVMFPLVTGSFLSEILQGVDDILNDYGYSMLLGTYKNFDSFKHKISVMKAKGIDGIVAIGDNRQEYAEEYLKLSKSGMPLSFIARNLEIPGTSCVYVDGWKIGYLAGEYLAGLGHKQILAVHQEQPDRMAGFADSLKKRGLDFEQETLKWGTDPFESGRKLTGRFAVGKLPVTAFFVNSEVMAAGIIYEASRLGINIPHDLSIIAVNNEPVSKMTSPKITTVAQPHFEQGAGAAELLMKKLKGEPATEDVKILEPYIIERESCGKPNPRR